VALGAGVKGRSPSRLLCTVWRRNAAWFLAGSLYPGFHWVWSAFNRGDAPSRALDIPPPGRHVPAWAIAALHGDFTGWDWVRSGGGVSLPAANWIRLVTAAWTGLGGFLPPAL